MQSGLVKKLPNEFSVTKLAEQSDMRRNNVGERKWEHLQLPGLRVVCLMTDMWSTVLYSVFLCVWTVVYGGYVLGGAD